MTDQFKEVRLLSRRVEKPVMHLTLRVAPGDHLDKNQLIEIGRACAKEFGLDKNQYVTILHKDTNEQHIHIVANRVGYDGKVANDSHSYARMARLCRRLEKEYNLKEVLSPRRFLSQKERLIPRHDIRKEKLRQDIGVALKGSRQYQEFEKKMKALGYQVIKARGIAFVDEKKVRIKGSEVNYSLQTIERILERQRIQELRKNPLYQQQQQEKIKKSKPVRKTLGKHVEGKTQNYLPADRRDSIQWFSGLLADLMKPEQIGDSGPGGFQFGPRKKKKKRRGHHF